MPGNGSAGIFLFRHRTAKTTGINANGVVTVITHVTEIFPFAIGFGARMTKGNAIHDKASARRVKLAQVFERDCREGVPIRHHQHRESFCVEIG